MWSGPSMPIIESAPMGSMRPVRSGELNSHRMNAGVPAVNESRVALADTTLGCRSTAEHISWEVVMTPRSARTTRPCSRSQSYVGYGSVNIAGSSSRPVRSPRRRMPARTPLRTLSRTTPVTAWRTVLTVSIVLIEFHLSARRLGSPRTLQM